MGFEPTTFCMAKRAEDGAETATNRSIKR